MNDPYALDGYADVLYQDPHLIVCNKYSEIPVIPERNAAKGQLSLRERLEQAVGEKVYVVHRIDRATSGLVVFCRTAAAHRMLNTQFEQRLVIKEYLALVQGVVDGSMVVDEPLRQFGSGRIGVHPDGKPSLTEVVVLERREGTTLVKAMPKTGRRHQIRVHLYHTGHPVMGDRRYGKERPVGGCERMMLHASSIACIHPEGKKFHIEVPVDTLWEKCVSRYPLSDVSSENL